MVCTYIHIVHLYIKCHISDARKSLKDYTQHTNQLPSILSSFSFLFFSFYFLFFFLLSYLLIVPTRERFVRRVRCRVVVRWSGTTLARGIYPHATSRRHLLTLRSAPLPMISLDLIFTHIVHCL